ncbi:ribonuclease III [Fomitiporia mediterranea MF3/22]|uniref:ribonuclease III n=1 Tax=Fomitiporia mediterranea (strain MF3/22) TaxID=694068 RepID=UPI0004409511|nr:ribonuclease III [Fomitiporia mediterranea MF3/22]EJD01346.1 ribonuclease III [Fomitiporia mediterranea MF3/22]
MRSQLRRVPFRALTSRATRASALHRRFTTSDQSSQVCTAQLYRRIPGRERTGLIETRRSLSETLNGSFVDIQHHQRASPRLYSSSSSPQSDPGPSSASLDSAPPPPPLASEFEDFLPPPEPDEIVVLGDVETIFDPSMLALKPDLDATGGLPPLPTIRDEALRRQAFTHRSVYARSRHDFEDSHSDPAPDNELLEYQGDAVLGLVITDLVRDCYRYLRVGPATKVRSLVVGNATLADISVKYALPQKLRFHRANASTNKISINIQGKFPDVFEAYVGGLYKDQGLEVVRRWLNPLFLPYVKEAYRVCRDQHGLPSPPPSPTLPDAQNDGSTTSTPDTLDSSASASQESVSDQLASLQISNGNNTIGHLALFNQYLQQKRMTVEWVFHAVQDEGTKVTPIWEVRAMVEGEQVSVGRASTKKGAQSEAAREGLVQLGISNPLE